MTPALDVSAALADGLAALERGQYANAAEAFVRVQQEMPGEIAVALMVANAYRLAGNTVAEREALLKTHRAFWGNGDVEQGDVTAIYQLGAALLDAGAPSEARRCFERVVKQRPKDPAALGALAGALRADGDPQRAWPIIQRAMALTSKQPALLLTAAQIRHALGDLARARYWLDRAESLRPAHSPTRLQRALTSLLAGPTAAGWADFEHRGLPAPPDTGAAPWHGEPLAGQSILVTSEQGHGDNFQFVRFVTDLTARGASRVVVECHPTAVSLFAASGLNAVAKGQAPPTDWYVPMLSLPYRLEVGNDTAAGRIPYLRAKSRLDVAPKGRCRLGVVWQGNPAFLATTLRDFDTALLPQLLAIPKVDWVSLQHGTSPPASGTSLSIPPLADDWLATAQLLSKLDGLVTVDTGIAHLAGAMGLRTFIMLPFSPDWRWGLERETTLWYPSARLVRQRKSGDWASVVEQLTGLLSSIDHEGFR